MPDEFAALRISVEASLEDFSSKMTQFEDILKGTEKQAEDTGKSWTNMFSSFLTADMAKDALYKLKDVALESIHVFDDYVVVLAQLKMQLGEGYQAIVKYAEERSKLTRYDDAQYLAAAKMLSMHKLNTEQILQILPVIEDASTKTGSLTGATQAFAYAIDFGVTRGLRPYGVSLEKGMSQQETFNYLVKHGADNTKGMAEEMGKLGEGPLIRMKNQMQDAQRELGANLTPTMQFFAEMMRDVIVPVVTGLVEVFHKVQLGFYGLGIQITAFVSGMRDEFKDMTLIDFLNPVTMIRHLVKSGKDLGTVWADSFKLAQKAVMEKVAEEEALKSDTYSSAGRTGGLPTKPGSSGLSGEERGRGAGGAGEDPAITSAKAALKGWEVLSKAILGEIEVAFKENEVSISSYYEAQAANAEIMADKQREELAVEMKLAVAAKDQTKIDVIQQKIDAVSIELQAEKIKLKHEETEALKKNMVEEQKAIALLTKIAEKETETEGGGAIMKIRRKYGKMADEQDKYMQEITDNESAWLKKGLIDKESIEAAKTEIHKAQSNIRMQQEAEEVQFAMQTAATEVDYLDQIFTALYELGGRKSLALFELHKQLSAMKCMINTAEGIMKAQTDPGGVAGIILGVTIGVMGAVQLATIEAQQPPKMAVGGLIRGPAHAGGGVMVNAEGGEYVTRKSAVNYYGTRAMEAINMGLVPPQVLQAYSPSQARAVTTHAAAGGKVSGGTSTVIVNYIDPALMKKFLASADGRKAVLNVISGNSYSFRKALSI